MAFRRRGRNETHHQLDLSLLLQLTRRHTTPTPHRQYFYLTINGASTATFKTSPGALAITSCSRIFCI